MEPECLYNLLQLPKEASLPVLEELPQGAGPHGAGGGAEGALHRFPRRRLTTCLFSPCLHLLSYTRQPFLDSGTFHSYPHAPHNHTPLGS